MNKELYEKLIQSKIGKLVGIIPINLCYFIASLIGNVFYIFNIYNLKNNTINCITLVFRDEKSEKEIKKIAKKNLIESCKYFVDIFFLINANEKKIKYQFDKKVHIEGIENYIRALKTGKPIVFLSAHLGCFYYGLLTPKIKELEKINIIKRYSYSIIRTRIFNRFSSIRKINEIILGTQQIRTLFYRLKKGEIIACMFDYAYTGTRVILSKFLGHLALTSAGISLLSQRTNALVIPVFVIRQKNNSFVMYIDPPLKLSNSGDEIKDMYLNTLEFNRTLEKYIKKFPDQWNMMWLSLPDRWHIREKTFEAYH